MDSLILQRFIVKAGNASNSMIDGILLNSYINMRLNIYGFIPVFWINAVITITALWNICKWIDKKIDLRILKEIGSQSLFYVCINKMLLVILTRISLLINITMSSAVWNIIETTTNIVICFISNRLLMKTPLKILMGK